MARARSSSLCEVSVAFGGARAPRIGTSAKSNPPPPLASIPDLPASTALWLAACVCVAYWLYLACCSGVIFGACALVPPIFTAMLAGSSYPCPIVSAETADAACAPAWTGLAHGHERLPGRFGGAPGGSGISVCRGGLQRSLVKFRLKSSDRADVVRRETRPGWVIERRRLVQFRERGLVARFDAGECRLCGQEVAVRVLVPLAVLHIDLGQLLDLLGAHLLRSYHPRQRVGCGPPNLTRFWS